MTLEALLDATEDDDMVDFIEEALENLSFTQDMEDFSCLAVDPDEEPNEDSHRGNGHKTPPAAKR